MLNSLYLWLLLGAAFGVVVVFLLTTLAGFALSGWLGALIPTLSAVVAGTIGPKLGASDDEPRKVIA